MENDIEQPIQPAESIGDTVSPVTVATVPTPPKSNVLTIVLAIATFAAIITSVFFFWLMNNYRRDLADLERQDALASPAPTATPTPPPINLFTSPSPSPDKSSPTPKPSPTETPLPTPVPEKKYTLTNWTNYLAFLKSNCQQVVANSQGSYMFGVPTGNLPLAIDSNIFEMYIKDAMFCTESYGSDNQPYGLAFQGKQLGVVSDWRMFYIYNDKTVEQKGTNFYGLKGTTVGSIGDTTFSVYLNEPNSSYCGLPGGEKGYFADTVELILRAQKRIPLTSGENIYVNMFKVAITADNDLIKPIYNESSFNCSESTPRRTVTDDGVGVKVRDRIFKNMADPDSLPSPVKESVAEITKLFGAITVK